MKLKFNIRFRNMVVHTCWCIYFFELCGFDSNWKHSKCFWKKIGSGFEVKENMKIKEFKKGKIYFWRTYPNFSILFELKSVFQIIFEFDLVCIWIWIWKQNGKDLENGKSLFLLLGPKACFSFSSRRPTSSCSPSFPAYGPPRPKLQHRCPAA